VKLALLLLLLVPRSLWSPPLPPYEPLAAPTTSLPVLNASWYGPGFYGHQTANGEVYRPFHFTAASWDYPFGTELRVTNLLNGRTVEVRVNDTGRFYLYGRDLDLSYAAALALDMVREGVVPVTVEML
jgi:rare lipoprotein A